MKIKVVKVVSFLGASFLVLLSFLPSAHALASVDFAIKEICSHLQGNLGGLLMAAAGVGGIASAAFGNMKAMYSCLVTAIGAFGISSVLSLHFADAATKCNGGAGAGAGANARVISNNSVTKSEVSKFDPESAAKSYISYYKNEETVAEPGSKSESDITTEAKTEDEDSDLDLF